MSAQKEKVLTLEEQEMAEERAKYDQISEVIATYKDKPGSLIQVLHTAQNIYGYLPLTLQSFIADGMNKPISEVSGVISFYSLFSTVPQADNAVKVCMGTACYVRGGQRIVERLEEELGIKVGETTEDQKFSIEITRCVGACGLAPVMNIGEEVFQQVNPDKLDKILAKY